MPTVASEGLRRDIFEIFGDHGADTLDRYFAQIEYTAVWCVRMLDARERVRAVIPEAVDDLLVIRNGRFELRQVKSRDESVGAWSIADVIPILAAQYTRSFAFGPRSFSFHFISDARADVRKNQRLQLASLESLKSLLQLRHRGMQLNADEAAALKLFLERLPPLILEHVAPPHGNSCDAGRVGAFLLQSHIDTNEAEFRSSPSIELLDKGLRCARPNGPELSVAELKSIYDRLLLLIVRRIREGTDLRSRAILKRDVLKCCRPQASEQSIDFRAMHPRVSMLEAKSLYGGFDQYEARQFRQELSRAKVRRRELAALGLAEPVDDLDIALGDLHRRERRLLSNQSPRPAAFGPALLERLHPQFAALAAAYLPRLATGTLFCQGILWDRTQRCQSAWHPIAEPVLSPSYTESTPIVDPVDFVAAPAESDLL